MLEYKIEEVSFKHNNEQYLDVSINHEEGYITLKINDNEFDIEEYDWRIIKEKIDEFFKMLK